MNVKERMDVLKALWFCLQAGQGGMNGEHRLCC